MGLGFGAVVLDADSRSADLAELTGEVSVV
jgi:hypothetical protein